MRTGSRVEIPPEGPDRIVTPIEQGGERGRRDHPRRLAARTSASSSGPSPRPPSWRSRTNGSANELRAKIEELSASRARIVESGDAARRRLERDLHDGAQQRLVSLALSLRILRSRLDGDPDAVRELESARGELDAALAELRELARGIHPSVLSDRGLDAALDGLAHRAPLPVELEAHARRAAARIASSPRPTSWWPRRSPTSPSTRTRPTRA